MRIARHFGMDWLRIGAFALLILYHIGMVFVPWNYHVKTAHPIDATIIPMLALNPWRLSLLFVVSGFASRALFAKLGSLARFLRERTARLIVPLLFGIVVIVPPQPWAELVSKHGYAHGYLWFWLHDYFRFGALDGLILPTWNHLWFVAYLWVYTLMLAVALGVLPDRVQMRISRGAEVALGGWRVLVVPTALLLGNAALVWPYHTETHDLINDFPVHRIYLAMFLFGFLLASAPRVWAGIARWWQPAAGLALASYAVAVAVELRWPGNDVPPASIITLIVAARAIQAWSTIVALLGIADRWLNVDHPWRATLAEAVFPFYIVHQTIIVVVGWSILRFGLHPATEFAILLVATVAGCGLFYGVGREIGWLRPLIGLKYQSGQA